MGLAICTRYNFSTDKNKKNWWKIEGIILPGKKIASILGYNGTLDEFCYHIGTTMFIKFSKFCHNRSRKNIFAGDYDFDLSEVKQLIFIYVYIIWPN